MADISRSSTFASEDGIRSSAPARVKLPFQYSYVFEGSDYMERMDDMLINRRGDDPLDKLMASDKTEPQIKFKLETLKMKPKKAAQAPVDVVHPVAPTLVVTKPICEGMSDVAERSATKRKGIDRTIVTNAKIEPTATSPSDRLQGFDPSAFSTPFVPRAATQKQPDICTPIFPETTPARPYLKILAPYMSSPQKQTPGLGTRIPQPISRLVLPNAPTGNPSPAKSPAKGPNSNSISVTVNIHNAPEQGKSPAAPAVDDTPKDSGSSHTKIHPKRIQFEESRSSEPITPIEVIGNTSDESIEPPLQLVQNRPATPGPTNQPKGFTPSSFSRTVDGSNQPKDGTYVKVPNRTFDIAQPLSERKNHETSAYTNSQNTYSIDGRAISGITESKVEQMEVPRPDSLLDWPNVKTPKSDFASQSPAKKTAQAPRSPVQPPSPYRPSDFNLDELPLGSEKSADDDLEAPQDLRATKMFGPVNHTDADFESAALTEEESASISGDGSSAQESIAPAEEVVEQSRDRSLQKQRSWKNLKFQLSPSSKPSHLAEVPKPHRVSDLRQSLSNLSRIKPVDSFSKVAPPIDFRDDDVITEFSPSRMKDFITKAKSATSANNLTSTSNLTLNQNKRGRQKKKVNTDLLELEKSLMKRATNPEQSSRRRLYTGDLALIDSAEGDSGSSPESSTSSSSPDLVSVSVQVTLANHTAEEADSESKINTATEVSLPNPDVFKVPVAPLAAKSKKRISKKSQSTSMPAIGISTSEPSQTIEADASVNTSANLGESADTSHKSIDMVKTKKNRGRSKKITKTTTNSLASQSPERAAVDEPAIAQVESQIAAPKQPPKSEKIKKKATKASSARQETESSNNMTPEPTVRVTRQRDGNRADRFDLKKKVFASSTKIVTSKRNETKNNNIKAKKIADQQRKEKKVKEPAKARTAGKSKRSSSKQPNSMEQSEPPAKVRRTEHQQPQESWLEKLHTMELAEFKRVPTEDEKEKSMMQKLPNGKILGNVPYDTINFINCDGVDLGFFMSPEQRQFGLMRFHPKGRKGASRNPSSSTIYHILTGCLTFLIDKHEIDHHSGGVVIIPSDTKYSIVNRTKTICVATFQLDY